MRCIIYFLLLLIEFTANAQDFSGNYISEYTSFKDNKAPANNFQESSKFNVAIIFEDKDTGMVSIQDTRMPNKSPHL